MLINHIAAFNQLKEHLFFNTCICMYFFYQLLNYLEKHRNCLEINSNRTRHKSMDSYQEKYHHNTTCLCNSENHFSPTLFSLSPFSFPCSVSPLLKLRSRITSPLVDLEFLPELHLISRIHRSVPLEKTLEGGLYGSTSLLSSLPSQKSSLPESTPKM